ncbi:MAG: hypothetical protein GTO18_11685 [Anaerolineales bacterium]|nr:hypothetical protein [Anaerolineales bacterium]
MLFNGSGSDNWRIARGRRTISRMVGRNEFLRALAFSLLGAVLALIPYWIAPMISETEFTFSGFLINPIDGFSYLAKMQQGMEGSWLFKLPYASEPGEGAFLFVYHLFLGHIASWFDTSVLTVYQLAKFPASVLMYLASFFLLAQIFEKPHLRWGAFALILVGSGVGWIAIPFGIIASDLWIPESIPFLSAYTNAHFSLAAALFLIIIILFLKDRISILWRLLAVFFSSTLLAAIQPFAILVVAAVLFTWICWEFVEQYRNNGLFKLTEKARSRLLAFVTMLLGALPWLIYDFYVTQTHPVLREWNAQNLTPSPPLWEYILGYGPVLILSLVAIFRTRAYQNESGRFLIAWAVLQFVLLYAPFNLQRRLTLGLYFALAALAVLGLDILVKDIKKYRLGIVILILITIPSNLIIIFSGLSAVRSSDPTIMLEENETAAYQWLSDYAHEGALILAGPRAGNRIPAYANLRVLYGHPFETPKATDQLEAIQDYFSYSGDALVALQEFKDLGIRYVLYGVEEQDIGSPTWLVALNQVFLAGRYAIYEITH